MSDLSRRTFTQALAGAALMPAAVQRPNIVFITSDQHSGRALASNGYSFVRTPNLDRLMARGVHFRNAYSGNPVCAPGRASMMTGRYASDVNSYCNSTPLGHVPSWGNHLRDAGYYCWATAKLDLTLGADYGFKEVRDVARPLAASRHYLAVSIARLLPPRGALGRPGKVPR